MKEIYLDKIKGVLDEESFKILNQGLLKDRKHLEDNIKETNKSIEKLHYEMNTKNALERFVEQYTKVEYLDREMIDMLIDHIEVSKKNPETGEVMIDVYWNF